MESRRVSKRKGTTETVQNVEEKKPKGVKKVEEDGKTATNPKKTKKAEASTSVSGSTKSSKDSKPKDAKPKKKLNPLPDRKENGDLIFKDHPEFVPNMTPKEVLQAGSFGGAYYRDIYSSVLGQKCTDAWKELPKDWLEGLDIDTQVSSQTYRETVNKYKAKCGGSLQMWEESGWIKKQDPYGWFQWFCRFYLGRRTKDDDRQISRFNKSVGPKGRWRSNLVTKIYKANAKINDKSISPVVRQVHQHWGYTLTQSHYDLGAKAVANRLKGK